MFAWLTFLYPGLFSWLGGAILPGRGSLSVDTLLCRIYGIYDSGSLGPQYIRGITRHNNRVPYNLLDLNLPNTYFFSARLESLAGKHV